jgi:N-acetylmuramoyl-L-alanine amidase
VTSRVTGCLALLCGMVLAGPQPAGANERAVERVNVARANAPVDAAFPVATDARLAGDSNRTRLVIDLSRAVELTAFTLADPYRVVIDLPQITFSLPAKAGEGRRGLVKAFRYGLVMAGGSRVVIDLSGPVRVDKAFVLDPIDNQPARLVLDLVATDRDSFMRHLALESRRRPAPAEAAKRETPPKRSDDPRPLVVIDPGHGGPDTGTVASTGDMEKTMVLEFAHALRERLEKTGKYRVHMTRTDDRFIPLAERVRIARSHEAALFISVHADALAKDDGETRGATVYTLSEDATDAEAARLADAENRADVIAGVDLSTEPGEVADILIDLAQRETKNFSAHFARALVSELKTAARMHKKPLKSAGFRVLKAPDVPSVLIELGYVTNPKDLKMIMSEGWRARVTEAMTQAVGNFFTQRVAGRPSGRGPN